MEFKITLSNEEQVFEVKEATRKEVMQLAALVRCLYHGEKYDSAVLIKLHELVENVSGLGTDSGFLALPVFHQSFALEHLAHMYIGGLPGN